MRRPVSIFCQLLASRFPLYLFFFTLASLFASFYFFAYTWNFGSDSLKQRLIYLFDNQIMSWIYFLRFLLWKWALPQGHLSSFHLSLFYKVEFVMLSFSLYALCLSLRLPFIKNYLYLPTEDGCQSSLGRFLLSSFQHYSQNICLLLFLGEEFSLRNIFTILLFSNV